VAYIASEWLYRKTNILLVIFISCFIIFQYVFSLIYKRYKDDEAMIEDFKWAGFFETMPDWRDGSSVYFRHTPYPFYWLILILMALLKRINVMFTQSSQNKENKE